MSRESDIFVYLIQDLNWWAYLPIENSVMSIDQYKHDMMSIDQ